MTMLFTIFGGIFRHVQVILEEMATKGVGGHHQLFIVVAPTPSHDDAGMGRK